MAGIVDQHIQPLVAGENFRHGRLPGVRAGDVQGYGAAAIRVLAGQFAGLIKARMDAEPDLIIRGFLEERLRNGLAQAAIGAGDQKDTRIHQARVPAIGREDKPEIVWGTLLK